MAEEIVRIAVAMKGSPSTSPHRRTGTRRILSTERGASRAQPAPRGRTMVLGRMFGLPLDSFFASEGVCPRLSAVCRRVVLVLPLAINLLALTALAFASPPDAELDSRHLRRRRL
jgi:hypothetical protein